MSTHTTTFAWVGDQVIASVAGFHFGIALLEKYSDGRCGVYLYGWDTLEDEPAIPNTGDDGLKTMLELRARSRDEAVKMVEALLAVRGITLEGK